MVLHTWGQRLQHHPHVHCVVPAGGLVAGRDRWIHARPTLLPPDAGAAPGLSRANSSPGYARPFAQRRLSFPGASQPLGPRAPPSARCSGRSIARRGWSTRSRPLAAPPTCCTTSRGTPTASPSPITGSSPSPTTPCRFGGRTIDTAVSPDADARRRRVSPALPPARPAEALRPHPLLRLPRVAVPHPRTSRSVARRCARGHATATSRTASSPRTDDAHVAVPPLRGAHAHRRTADRATALPRTRSSRASSMTPRKPRALAPPARSSRARTRVRRRCVRTCGIDALALARRIAPPAVCRRRLGQARAPSRARSDRRGSSRLNGHS